MIKVGITGGIGSGKSLVCDIFRKLGVPVYVADDRAKMLMNSDAHIKNQLIERFGASVYKNGTLDRAKLAGIIFEDKEAIGFVNALVHPAVGADFLAWCNARNDQKYVIEEAALLFESGGYKQLDTIITVLAPENMRIERVIHRDGATPEQVKNRMTNQMSDEEKATRSDMVIYNDEKHSLLEQVLNLHYSFISSH
jgi:dephospho-CoA kinase